MAVYELSAIMLLYTIVEWNVLDKHRCANSYLVVCQNFKSNILRELVSVHHWQLEVN